MNIIPNQGATLSVNGLDPKPIVFRDSEKTNNFIKGAVYDFIYDGKSFNVKQAIPTGTITQGGFEVVSSLPTDNLFAGRQVSVNGRMFQKNTFGWLTQPKMYQVADYTWIDAQGWYNIGYYEQSYSSNAFIFNGFLQFYTTNATQQEMSAIVAIAGTTNKVSITQLSSSLSTQIIEKIRIISVPDESRMYIQLHYNSDKTNPLNISYIDFNSDIRKPFVPFFGKSEIVENESVIIKEFILADGLKSNHNVEDKTIIKSGGTATQMLMADGSTKEISDITTTHTIDGETLIIG